MLDHMPRPLRVQVPGGLYHVTARANIGRDAFRDDSERQQFLSLVAAVVARRRWSCRAFCLLSTHFHLLVATPASDLAAGMQYVNGRYAQWINWYRHERGHLFEGRYNSVVVRNQGHGSELHRYIALNPVRAGLVRNPEDWAWGSFPALVGLCAAPALLDVDSVLDEFGSGAAGRRRLRMFVWDGLSEAGSDRDD
jgi:REP-associated tyrosine transposase